MQKHTGKQKLGGTQIRRCSTGKPIEPSADLDDDDEDDDDDLDDWDDEEDDDCDDVADFPIRTSIERPRPERPPVHTHRRMFAVRMTEEELATGIHFPLTGYPKHVRDNPDGSFTIIMVIPE